MLWTSNSENCGTSLKKDSSKSKRPGYTKQSLIQPTMMMLRREPKKMVNFLPFEKFIARLPCDFPLVFKNVGSCRNCFSTSSTLLVTYFRGHFIS